MARLYNMDDVRANLEAIKTTNQQEPQHGLVLLTRANHALMFYAIANGLMEKIDTLDDMPLLDPFWQLCQKYGFNFTDKEKIEILTDFIED